MRQSVLAVMSKVVERANRQDTEAFSNHKNLIRNEAFSLKTYKLRYQAKRIQNNPD